MDWTTIRALEIEDIPTVADIAENAMAYPWSEEVFHSCMKADYHGWMISEDSVADGPNSVVYDQADNLLHARKAFLASILADVSILEKI